jgi:uncharacterized protein (TIGR03437 family)
VYFCGFTNILQPYWQIRQSAFGREIHGGWGQAVMKSFVSRSLFLFLTVAILAALAPIGYAQVSSFTQVSTNPPGLAYSIDGEVFVQNSSFNWPAGSKHTLFAPPVLFAANGNVQYAFQGWTWPGGTIPGGNSILITADPSISSYVATYGTAYSLSLVYSACPPDTATCMSPGTVYVNGAPYNHDATIYVAAGSATVLQAQPADGFVFAGWGSINSTTVIVGFQQTITVNQPVTIYPMFQVARTMNLLTVPPNLQVLEDRTVIGAPASVQWGVGSTHTVGVVSPQQDRQGQFWVFSSWSDGGDSTHPYKVPAIINPDTLTATFAPAALVGFYTDPPGVTLSVDGRTNWNSFNFVWGVGETHTVSAPAQQTDADGRIWNFTKWSNGGTASQSVTVLPAAATAGIRLTASYTQVAHLTVNSALGGSVTIDGSACSVPCDVYKPLGAQVDVGAPLTLPVAPGSRKDFQSWSVSGAAASSTAAGGDLLVTLGTDTAIVAPVYHLMNNLAADSLPASGATFVMKPSSPDGYYDSLANVTVTASALPGYRFRAWNGDLSSLAATGVLAMSAPRTITALLDTVPYIEPTGIVNGAGITPTAGLAPGSVVSVFGANLAPTTAVGPSSPLAQTLGGITARVGARMLPLYFVSPGQINLELPSGLPLGQQTLTVSSPGQPDAQATFQVAAEAPGIFAASVSDGVTFGFVLRSDGSLVTSAAPARAGEILTLIGTGFGPTLPNRPDGFPVPASPTFLLTDPATVQLGGVSVTPSKAYAWPGAVGLDAIQFAVPAGLPAATNAALTVSINSVLSNTVQLPLQ